MLIQNKTYRLILLSLALFLTFPRAFSQGEEDFPLPPSSFSDPKTQKPSTPTKQVPPVEPTIPQEGLAPAPVQGHPGASAQGNKAVPLAHGHMATAAQGVAPGSPAAMLPQAAAAAVAAQGNKTAPVMPQNQAAPLQEQDIKPALESATDLNNLSSQEQQALKDQELALENDDSNKLVDLSKTKLERDVEKGQGLIWFFATLLILLFVIFVFT